MDFQPLEMPPINVRAKYYAYRKEDTTFTANARLLQSIWRRCQYGDDILGSSENGKTWGNLLPIDFAIAQKANFLTDRIFHLVQNKIKSGKGLISEPRIWNNLLSSQPLCFNLFGELSFNKSLATQLFQKLFPNKISEIIDIDFEFQPPEKPHRDHTAFDVFISYISPTKKKGFIGIEVKYSEDLSAKPAEFKKEYLETALQSNIFKTDSIEKLKKAPLEQIWRDHLLCLAILGSDRAERYDEGFFVFLYPEKNKECFNGVNQYKQTFLNPDSDENKFYSLTLEEVIKVLKEIENSKWIADFEDRYLCFGKMDSIIGEDKYWQALTYSYIVKRTFEQSLDFLNKAIQINPNDSRAYFWKELALREMGRFDEVVTCCDQLIFLYETKIKKANELFPDFYFHKQEALFQLRRYSEALEVIRKILQDINADDFDSMEQCIGLGEQYIEMGMLKEANTIANDLMKFADYGEAVKFIEKTLNLVKK